MKLKTCGIIITMLLTIISCDDQTGNEKKVTNSNNQPEIPINPLHGYWMLTNSHYSYPLDGSTMFEEEQVRDGSIDQYFNGKMIKIDDEFFSDLENVNGPSHHQEDFTYEIDGESIIVEKTNKTMTYSYSLDGDMLILTYRRVFPNQSYSTSVFTYERRELLPIPTSWYETISNDANEPNDEHTASVELELGTTSDIHVLIDQDKDFFSFRGEAGKNYLVRVLSHFDTGLGIYRENPDGDFLLAMYLDNNNDAYHNNVGVNNSNVGVIESTEAQDYYFSVYTGNNSDVGYYQVIVTETDLPYVN